MADEWDQYIVKSEPQDEWAQYVVPSKSSNINPTGKTWSPQDYLEQEQVKIAAEKRPARFGFTAEQYFKEAQPAFKMALTQPGAMLGNQVISPEAINKTASSEYSDLYRNANLPGSNSTNMAGQMIPQLAGGLLDIGTRPSSVILPEALKGIAKTPIGQELGKFLTKQRGFLNLGGQKTAQKIAEKADKGIDKVGQFMSTKYDDLFNELKTAKGTAKVDDILTSIDDVKSSYPTEFAGKLKQIQTKLANVQKTGKGLSAEELLNLKQEARKLVPKPVWQGRIEPDALQASKQEIYYKINDALGSLGGEKYKTLSGEYRQFKEAQRLIGKVFYNQGVPSNARVGAPIDIPQRRAMETINNQLAPKEQFLAQLEAWRRGQAVKKVAPWVAGGGVGSAIVNYALNQKQ